MHLVVHMPEKTHVNKMLIQPNGMTNLSVEGTFIVCISIEGKAHNIGLLHHHKIRCRSIPWCWIAAFTIKIVSGMMVDIVM